MSQYHSAKKLHLSLLITSLLVMNAALAGPAGAVTGASTPAQRFALPSHGVSLQTTVVMPLENPDFEDGWAYTACDAYDAYGRYSYSAPFGEIFVPDHWRVFFKEGTPVQHDLTNTVGWAKPEVKLIEKKDPFLDPPRVYSGQKAMQLFTFWKIHDAGFYQQVSVQPGTLWRLSAWTHAWSSTLDDPDYSTDSENVTQMVGLDPTGGTNPYAATVVWSAPNHIIDVYAETHEVQAVARSRTMTVFLRSWVKWPFKHNDVYWDQVNLELIGIPTYLPLIASDRSAVEPPPPPPPQADTQFGLVFVNPAEPYLPTDEGRYDKARELGIGWDRWPLYWYHVESSAGQFNWSAYDTIVEADLGHGLQVNAILLGTPSFYASAGIDLPAPSLGFHGSGLAQTPAATANIMSPPVRLFDPVFADGTDLPGPGKTINPNNPWANLVYSAVERYRPGGVLAEEKDWPADRGVRVWEVWNEPDLTLFWSGSVADYTRLLKVAALAARHADPEAIIMTGGLANPPAPGLEAPGYLESLMIQLSQDPDPALRDSQGWYFDAVAVHNYTWSWQTKERVRQARKTIDYYQTLYPSLGEKSIWLNESGAAVWNDYPGPTWQSNGEANHMATMEEQAAFIIQNAVYGLYEGAAKIFHFQLYDGCGNDPPGTDFPPDSLYLCDQGLPCASASAFGLWRNKNTDSCYTQHPQPDTPRPAYGALRTVVGTLAGAQVQGHLIIDGNQERFFFYRPDTQERIIALWARYYYPITTTVEAVSSQATLLDQAGTSTTIYPNGGVYTITLPAATDLNLPDPPDGTAPIGGRPFFLIEDQTSSALQPEDG